jgi:uncharacterized protein YjbI with pentapeptide repeats
MPEGGPPIVVPRVYALKQTGTLRLDHAVRCYAGTGGTSIIALTGGPGSGKSTAIEFLRTALPPKPAVLLFDEPSAVEPGRAARRSLVIYSAPARHNLEESVELRLAPWDTDEFIEYLLATNRTRVNSVMSRLERDSQRRLIGGVPELWRPILDLMAADETIPDSLIALRHVIDAVYPTKCRTRRLIDACLERLNQPDSAEWKLPTREYLRPRWHRPPPALRHRAGRLVVVLDSILRDLTLRRRNSLATRPLPKDVINLCGRAAAKIGAVRAGLLEMLGDRRTKLHGTIASILHASGTGWEFPAGVVPDLSHADLAGAWFRNQQWPGLLARRADLDGADLSECNLDGASFEETALRGARLNGASLERTRLWAAGLNRADLSGADLNRAFIRSDLEEADLSDATLMEAEIHYSILTRARFVGANMHRVQILHCTLEDTDFTRADLSRARLSELSFRTARLDGSDFSAASLHRCDMQGVVFRAAKFPRAKFCDVDLTSSQCPSADFRGATLADCGLAEIEWENADLRDADLRRVTFHAGSSRSGLVGSPLACEGSRTGFYTDESGEQDFKSPEEIRKANLCGADLRGARIDAVDFYLVDLRGAHLDPSQLEWLRRCGAILG